MGSALVATERWYLGTVVRLTLTDRLDPTVDRSITLNATVVRLLLRRKRLTWAEGLRTDRSRCSLREGRPRDRAR